MPGGLAGDTNIHNRHDDGRHREHGSVEGPLTTTRSIGLPAAWRATAACNLGTALTQSEISLAYGALSSVKKALEGRLNGQKSHLLERQAPQALAEHVLHQRLCRGLLELGMQVRQGEQHATPPQQAAARRCSR